MALHSIAGPCYTIDMDITITLTQRQVDAVEQQRLMTRGPNGAPAFPDVATFLADRIANNVMQQFMYQEDELVAARKQAEAAQLALLEAQQKVTKVQVK